MTEATHPQARNTPTGEIPQKTREQIIALKKQGYGKRMIAPRVGLSSKEVARVLRVAHCGAYLCELLDRVTDLLVK